MTSRRQSDEHGLPSLVSLLCCPDYAVEQGSAVFQTTDAVGPDALMLADTYRARARDLTASANALPNYDLILEAESLAAAWRDLAVLADLQDAMSVALAATRD